MGKLVRIETNIIPQQEKQIRETQNVSNELISQQLRLSKNIDKVKNRILKVIEIIGKKQTHINASKLLYKKRKLSNAIVNLDESIKKLDTELIKLESIIIDIDKNPGGFYTIAVLKELAESISTILLVAEDFRANIMSGRGNMLHGTIEQTQTGIGQVFLGLENTERYIGPVHKKIARWINRFVNTQIISMDSSFHPTFITPEIIYLSSIRTLKEYKPNNVHISYSSYCKERLDGDFELLQSTFLGIIYRLYAASLGNNQKSHHIDFGSIFDTTTGHVVIQISHNIGVKWEEAKHLTKKDVQIALHKPIKKYSDSHDIEIIIQKLGGTIYETKKDGANSIQNKGRTTLSISLPRVLPKIYVQAKDAYRKLGIIPEDETLHQTNDANGNLDKLLNKLREYQAKLQSLIKNNQNKE